MPRTDPHNLIREYQRTRDPRLREQLVHRYLPLARSLARRFASGGEPLEDLEQVAALALVKAVDGFDAERGTAFSSYAVPSIAGAIKRHFRDHGWSVRVPRELQERAMRVHQLENELSGALGESPTVAELADATLLGAEDVLEARVAYRALHASSLDAPTQDADGDDAGADRDDGRRRRRLQHGARPLGARLAARRARRARPRDRRAVLPRGAHAVGDRGAARLLADAHLAPAPARRRRAGEGRAP